MTETTKRLTKQMYGHEFRPTPNALFGLRAGQCRGGYDRTHNTGWYNREGEKLGFGDLDTNDFRRISSELEEGELFILLYESDSFWNFVERPGLIGSMATVKPDVHAPGVEYIAEKCMLIIARGQLYSVPTYGCNKEETEVYGIRAKVLSREQAKAMITAS